MLFFFIIFYEISYFYYSIHMSVLLLYAVIPVTIVVVKL